MSKERNMSVSCDLRKIEAQQECLKTPPTFIQQAVKDETQTKKSSEKRLKGESITMEQIIERLRQEPTEAEQDYRQYGKDEGLHFAKTASYKDLKYAACAFEPATEEEYYFETSILGDKILGEYFQEYFAQNPELKVSHETVGEYQDQFLDYLAEMWIDGWLEGVTEFWHQIQNKL